MVNGADRTFVRMSREAGLVWIQFMAPEIL